MRNHVAVYLTDEDRGRLRDFAEEKDLPMSPAARILIRDQLRYLAWKNKGKPIRRKRRA